MPRGIKLTSKHAQLLTNAKLVFESMFVNGEADRLKIYISKPASFERMTKGSLFFSAEGENGNNHSVRVRLNKNEIRIAEFKYLFRHNEEEYAAFRIRCDIAEKTVSHKASALQRAKPFLAVSIKDIDEELLEFFYSNPSNVDMSIFDIGDEPYTFPDTGFGIQRLWGQEIAIENVIDSDGNGKVERIVKADKYVCHEEWIENENINLSNAFITFSNRANFSNCVFRNANLIFKKEQYGDIYFSNCLFDDLTVTAPDSGVVIKSSYGEIINFNGRNLSCRNSMIRNLSFHQVKRYHSHSFTLYSSSVSKLSIRNEIEDTFDRDVKADIRESKVGHLLLWTTNKVNSANIDVRVCNGSSINHVSWLGSHYQESKITISHGDSMLFGRKMLRKNFKYEGIDFKGKNEYSQTAPFIAWKKARNGKGHKYIIIQLLIPEDANHNADLPVSASKKCRANKAEVLGFYDLCGKKLSPDDVQAYSIYDNSFKYNVGDKIEIDDYDSYDNEFTECAPGIHFYLEFEKAVGHY